MQDKEQLLKKPRKKNRFARFVFMLIIFIIIISLVFYSIENPSFIKNTIAKLKSFYASEEPVSGTDDAIDTFSAESIAAAAEDTATLEDTQDLEAGTLVTSKEDAEAGPGATQTFWQKILAFFKRGMKDDNNNFPASLTLKIYFASLGQEDKFSYEKRTVIAGNPQIAVENAVKELLEGPHKSFNFPVIPPGTKIKSVQIYQNLAKIDLSQEFLDNSLESGVLDEYVIYTIVNTVTQIPGIEGVVFLIEGRRIKIYGSVDLSIPAIKDDDFINEDDPLEEYTEDLSLSQTGSGE